MPPSRHEQDIMALARIAGAVAGKIFGPGVKVCVVAYREDDPAIQSIAGSDGETVRVRAALRKALADMEGLTAPKASAPPGVPISEARTTH